MAATTWESIIAILGKVWSGRNDAANWSGWISGDGPNRAVTVTAVSFEETGLDLKVKDGATSYDLKAVSVDLEHTQVELNGAVVPGAAMVFQAKPGISDLTRFAFDFCPVPLDSKSVRLNMRYDTHAGVA